MPRATAAIGVDLGGTAIKSGALDRAGNILAQRVVPTDAHQGPEAVLASMAGLIGHLAGEARSGGHEVVGVGVGVPGTLNRAAGEVISPPNLPGWRNVPVGRRLEEATGLRVVLDNDANQAAYGEYRLGAGRGVRSMVMLTLGTGVGGGIIVGGSVVRGASDGGGELGHMIVHVGGRRCGCGQRGCLEAYASARNTALRAEEAVRGGEASSMKAVLERVGELSAEDVEAAAKSGDALARRVWDETCLYLAVACINIKHALEPERIVLAGGMSAAGAMLLDGVRQAYGANASRMLPGRTEIVLATLGNDAGFMGGAMGVWEEVASGE